MTAMIDMTGKRFGRLVVTAKAYSDNGVYWDVLCACGNERTVKGTTLRNGKSTSCGCRQVEHIRAVGRRNRGKLKSTITYNGMHRRIRRLRGRALEHLCTCGAQAREWAYDHCDPNERTEIVTVGNWTGVVIYSLDALHYVPLCKSCHRRMDDAA